MKTIYTLKIQAWTWAAVSTFFMFTPLRAQEQLTREMTLEREYDPTVRDANKVNRLPEVKDPVFTKRAIDYSPFTTPADPDKEILLLPSGSVQTGISHNKRRGYLHLAGGMYTNLSGDLGYHIMDNHNGKMTVYATHNSTNGNVTFEGENHLKRIAKLNDNLVSLDFSHRLDNGSASSKTDLHLGASYAYTGFNYYGTAFRYSFSSVWTPDATDYVSNQANQALRFNIGLTGETRSLLYRISADVRHFEQKYGWTKDLAGLRENDIRPRLEVAKWLGASERQRIGLIAVADYFDYAYPRAYNNSDSTGYGNYLEATFTPYFFTEGDTWRLNIGANVMMITGDSTSVFASPNISVEAKVADKTVVYADATGAIGSNDAYSLSRVNRYLDHSVKVQPSRTWLDTRLGVRSGLATGLQVDVFAGYSRTRNAAFFVPATYMNERMDFASYSAALQTDAALLHAGAVLQYAYRKYIDFRLKGLYNQWSVESDGRIYTSYDVADVGMKPYGLPSVELSAGLTVRPLAPMALTLDYYMGTGRFTLLSNVERKMSDIHDLSLNASWRLNDVFGAYLRMNNLLFRQQELFYGYPLQRFSAMGGVNINF